MWGLGINTQLFWKLASFALIFGIVSGNYWSDLVGPDDDADGFVYVP